MSISRNLRLLTCAALLAQCFGVKAAVAPRTAQPSDTSLIVIHAGTLIAIPGHLPMRQASIVVRGGRIESVREGYAQIAGARVIDLKQKTVLPGLIDCHVHLTTPTLRKDAEHDPAKLSAADYALAGVVHSRQTLDAGFTTVRDVGADTEAIFALRNAIQQGQVVGPRIFAAGRLIAATGGHGDVRGYPDAIRDELVGASTCDGPFDCRRAVRLQVAHGADVIKIATTGGGGDSGGNEDAPAEMEADEVRAIVEVAHSLGRKVAAHAHGVAGILLALRSGVDSIEHGSFINSEAISLLRSQDATLVPTLSVLDRVAKELPDADPKDQPRMRAFLSEMPGNIGAAHRAGVRIAFGTDAGVIEHGTNAGEFGWYVRIGMTPVAALQTATVNAAHLLGQDKDIGTLEAGKLADVIATDGDPLNNVAALGKIVFVMKQGTVYRSAP
ncbi:MAG: amidohydrolase family protein [Proteobacteria bacterium]|nr:amidohydrolase family protein [Pseudomonadota bacterium]